MKEVVVTKVSGSYLSIQKQYEKLCSLENSVQNPQVNRR